MQATASCDEGTAMLEMATISPLAPSLLAVSLAAAPFAKYWQPVLPAGCDITNDDVFYFAESPFQMVRRPASFRQRTAA
jgi:hypothetical protein